MTKSPSARGRLGLRARVTIAFALGALALSASLSLLSYTLVRSFLVDQRQASAIDETYLNARLTRNGLESAPPGVVLESLRIRPGSSCLVFFDNKWYSCSLEVVRDSLPARLRQEVASGTPSRQAYRVDAGPRLAVGVPVTIDFAGDEPALYFQIFGMEELERSLRFLALALLGAGLATTVAGAALGRGAATRLIQPVADVATAAAAIAGGRLETRLDDVHDADLATLVSSFNFMADALQTRIERDARFASDVSHELRSPLTTLATTVGVLAGRRDEIPERSRVAVDLLSADVARFQRLVEDLLEVSRFDAGVAELHLEEVRLGELVERAVAQAGGVGIPISVSDPSLVVAVDKRRMVQVIVNLLENATRYGGGATGVGVDGGRQMARVWVEDAGPGVAPEERTQVFERFFRGSASGQRRGSGPGSGLGLALVAEHVRLHGGRVWVEGRSPGPGARFVVELPVGAG